MRARAAAARKHAARPADHLHTRRRRDVTGSCSRAYRSGLQHGKCGAEGAALGSASGAIEPWLTATDSCISILVFFKIVCMPGKAHGFVGNGPRPRSQPDGGLRHFFSSAKTEKWKNDTLCCYKVIWQCCPGQALTLKQKKLAAKIYSSAECPLNDMAME